MTKKKTPPPAAEAAAKAKQNFEFLTIIDGAIKKPVIEAESIDHAMAKFRRKWPKATVHKCFLVV